MLDATTLVASYRRAVAGVALFAGRVRHRLLDSGRSRRAIQYLSGSVLIGFGLRLLVGERPA